MGSGIGIINAIKKYGIAAHISRKKSGYTFNHNKGKKYNMKKKVCPNCGKMGAGPNMTRYHFENCKSG